MEKENRQLVEAGKAWMSKQEKILKKKLIDLLKDDGKGHKHAKYAQRLEDFDLNIVPIDVDPQFTAAISFDEGIIYVGEGFLRDPNTFGQLNVVMRHELCHNLLMHQIRMMHKIGDKEYSRIKFSQSFQSLLNIIMDYEISNKKYSPEDKETIRSLWLNGQLIKGLVTEDQRKNWMNMSVEEMYDELNKEIAKVKQDIKDGWNVNILSQHPDFHTREIAKMFNYKETRGPNMFSAPLADIKSGKVNNKLYREMAPQYRELVDKAYDAYKKDKKDELEKTIKTIADTDPLEQIKLKDGIELNTPEEKFLVIHVLKNLLGHFMPDPNDLKNKTKIKVNVRKETHSQDYKDMYNRVIQDLDDDSVKTSELMDALNSLS